MENLMKQIREKLTGAEEENKTEFGGSRDQKIPTQKSPSFKEKKMTLNWFQRQFSKKMSHDYDSIEMEHATAVAASVFAISQELSEIPQGKMKIREPPPQSTLSRIKSKVDVTTSPISLPSGASKRFSGSSKPTNDQENFKDHTGQKKPEKTMSMTPVPSMERTSTFGDKFKSNDDKKPEILAPKKTPTLDEEHLMNNNDAIKPAETPKPQVPPPIPHTMPERGSSSAGLRPPLIIWPPPPPSPPAPMRQASNRETKADVWERNELEKIKDRHKKLLDTIESWETRKKMKARRKLNKHEQSENERKRMKAMRKYEERMKYIDEIAGGARAQAEERRRNEVLRAKEKANVIRTTGKLPRPCSCF